jgi:NAD+--asparagine ADP-ribosyltransferase
MKKYHETKGVNAARTCASKQSQSMKRYWQSIPSKSEYQKNQSNLTMQQFLGVKNDK